MSRILTLGRQPSRTAPAEYRDAVALYARNIGAGGDIVWVDDPVNCWQVRLTLDPSDPRCRLRDGQNYEATELQQFVHPDSAHPCYPRHDPRLLDKLRRHPRSNRPLPGYVAYELGDLGVSGVLEILERGSLLTGRGEFGSAEEAMNAVLARQSASQERARAEKRQRARDVAVATRRRIFKIPFLPVEIDLGRRTAKET